MVKSLNIEEKIKIINEVGEEVINQEELRELFLNKKNPIAYDGFEPSGNIHIAQGLLRAINVNKLTSTGIKFKFWIADWFGMLNNKMGGDLEKIKIVGEYFIEVWKACGMDLENVEFIWASDFIKEHPEYWETVLKLSMNATINRVLRCGQIMGREENTNNPASQIFYPLMQIADIHHLGADITQLGMDQRKVNMLARDIFPKLGFKSPVIISHHMLMGLGKPPSASADRATRTVENKMSKSNPDNAIFMTDTTEDIKRKINKAYCLEGDIKENPVLEYCKYIIFESFDPTLLCRSEATLGVSRPEFVIERPAKFGGTVSFKTYAELETAFAAKQVHPMDLKIAVIKLLDQLLQPVRRHFEENKEAKELLQKVKSFQVTK